jgi:hypothetical protein
MGVTIYGRRLSDIRSTVNFVYIETPSRGIIFEGRTYVMLTLSDFIAVLSLCITCFSLGYAIGHSNKTKK